MSISPNAHVGNVFRAPGADATTTITNKRVYQVWKGSNRFFLGGRLVFGPDVRSLFLTLFLILAPVAVFCVFVGRHLMTHFSHHAGLAIMVVVVVHTCVVIILLMLTSARDPGIIPRNTHPPEPEDDAGSSSDWSGGQTPKPRLPRTKDISVNGVVIKIKYCDTCMLYRPPRCSHCSICNNCVERFDHHCPWVGQCIGKRNYPFFFAFVSSSTLLCLYIFAMCALRVKHLMDGDPPLNVWKALQKSPASAALMAYAFLATWFVGGLTAFHLYLMSTNQTTYENFRYRYDKKINPFNKGTLGNFKEVLCSGIPPSKVDFRAQAQPEVMGFGIFSLQQRVRDNSMDVLGLKNGKAHSSDIEIGGKSAWTPKSVSAQDTSGSVNMSGELIEDGRHGVDDSFPEAFSKPRPQEGGMMNAKGGAHPRRSSWGRQSGNWEASPELVAFPSGSERAGAGYPGDK